MKKTILSIAALGMIASCGSIQQPSAEMNLQTTAAEEGEQADKEIEVFNLAFGSFALYKNQDAEVGNEFCEKVINLDIVNGPTGDAFRVSSGLRGICELYVAPLHREYDVISVSEDGCGTRTIEARRVKGPDQFSKLLLEDHRNRLCDDYRPNLLTAQEVYVGGHTEDYFHLIPYINHDGGRGFTCMAYWVGYEIGPNNMCQQLGVSGCSNPFRFTTLEQCQTFYRL